MKLSQALPAFLTMAAAPLGSGLNLPTCAKQSNCLDFKVTELPSGTCESESDYGCEYQICVKTAFYKDGCTKPEGDAVDHICKKKKWFCQGAGGFDNPRSFKYDEVPTRWEQCQHVKPGDVAEFIFKDGSQGCSDTASVDIGGGVTAMCQGRPDTVPSCSTEPAGSECLWQAVAPMTCPTHGGMGGDPHIMRWNGKRFSYHGECDLVMIHSEEFGEGKGLDLHIRTTIDKFYSFVETMALKIGDDVLEINSEEVYFNKEVQSGLPAYISGYPVSVEEDGANKMIRIDLHDGDRIEVKIYKKFLAVNVAARKADFGNSVGLLGDFHTGAMLARDGETVIELDDEFGAEWQVRANEPKLFHDSNRAPQLPEETCRVPAISAARGLKNNDNLKAMAEKACREKAPADALDFCVFDVMATGDIGMAGAW